MKLDINLSESGSALLIIKNSAGKLVAGGHWNIVAGDNLTNVNGIHTPGIYQVFVAALQPELHHLHNEQIKIV